MNTCRLCKEVRPPLLKYGMRHYAHLKCALEKWGPAFLDKLRPWELGQLPFAVLKEYGLLKEVERRVREFGRDQKARARGSA